ncbi:adenylosuccinate lyase [bacterium]|nr:adenylosuccinate lyase [bacterium]
MIARYTRPKMGNLFSDKSKFDTWLQVELAVCEAWAERGVIPKAAYNRIKKKARFRLKRIEEIEAEVHHDVIAFTTAVADYIGEDSAYFHKGLTSSDVVDTAQNLILKEAGRLLEKELVRLRKLVGRRAVEHKRTPMIGRTHGVHAEPTTFGLKLLVWYDELGRHEERLAAAIDGLAVGKLSGAVGNFANIPPDLEEQVLKKLGLLAAPVSNQVVQRDRHAAFICTLAGIAATMEKIAVNLRTGQRTELSEVQEPFAKGQKGSSAMPHKKNPILLERVTGLARVLRGYAVTALENVALWEERDISHSGAERVILADACILLDYMLDKLAGVMENLVVRPERLLSNIYLTHGLVFSQRVLLALVAAGVSREEAYAMVQRNAMRCWEDGTPFLDALLHDSAVRGVLNAAQIKEQFSLEPYFKHVDALFVRTGLEQPSTVGRRQPSAPAPPAGAAAGHGPVQNISDRPSDWYETITANPISLSPVPIEGNETLGEADHQKRPPHRRSVRVQRGSRRAAPAKQKPPAGEKEPAAKPEKPVEGEAADKPEPAKKPMRRRRGTRGGRRNKKPTDAAASETKPADDDDTYVD